MKYFGWFKGTEHDDGEDVFDEYQKFENNIPKEKIIKHMQTCCLGVSSEITHDMFSGEELPVAKYEDGEFCFPLSFVHYLKNYDIGIPYDYEEYLKGILA